MSCAVWPGGHRERPACVAACPASRGHCLRCSSCGPARTVTRGARRPVPGSLLQNIQQNEICTKNNKTKAAASPVRISTPACQADGSETYRRHSACAPDLHSFPARCPFLRVSATVYLYYFAKMYTLIPIETVLPSGFYFYKKKTLESWYFVTNILF